MWVLLLCLGLVAAPSTQAAAAAGSIQGRKCQPQGLLKLDKPYAQPRRVELPFCQQYGCSCCNASHALTLQRASRVIAEDEDLSQDCKLGLLRLTCRVCDPQVSACGCGCCWPARHLNTCNPLASSRRWSGGHRQHTPTCLVCVSLSYVVPAGWRWHQEAHLS
jgi:hypothetical protein